MNRTELERSLATLHSDSFGWASRCCNDDLNAAEEVLQNTYLKILEGKAKFHQRSTFKTWLFAVIRFTAIDFLKKQPTNLKYFKEYNETLISTAPNIQSESIEQQFILKPYLHQLSPQQAQILHLVFYQDCSIKQAAEVMEIQIGTARTHYKRGKAQLKKLLIQTGCLPNHLINKKK